MPVNYCSNCGKPVVLRTPEGDDRPRHICDSCGAVHYQNPKMVVGAVASLEDRVLLCRRAIEPRAGLWTLPAGFMENRETVQEGAMRETQEEAGAKIENLRPFALLNLPFVSQVYLMFLADLASARFNAGHESLEVRLFSENEIPWEKIAFPVIEETLRLFFLDRNAGRFEFHIGTVTRRL